MTPDPDPRGLITLHHLWFIVYLWGYILIFALFQNRLKQATSFARRHAIFIIGATTIAIATVHSLHGFIPSDGRSTWGSPFIMLMYFVYFAGGLVFRGNACDRPVSWPAIFLGLATFVAMNSCSYYLRLLSVKFAGVIAVTGILLYFFYRLATQLPAPLRMAFACK